MSYCMKKVFGLVLIELEDHKFLTGKGYTTKGIRTKCIEKYRGAFGEPAPEELLDLEEYISSEFPRTKWEHREEIIKREKCEKESSKEKE